MSKGRSVERVEPDCGTCWKRTTCAKAEEGKFCPGWQHAEPEPEGTDPNDAWRRGDDVAF